MKEQLKKVLLKRMDEWGVKSHTRHCKQSSAYGSIDEETGMFVPNMETVIEEWTNEEFVNIILDIDDKELSDGCDELIELLVRG